MRTLTIGLVVLITAVVLTAGAAAAHGMAGAVADDAEVTDETPMDNRQNEHGTTMGEMDDCPMADGGMSGMMHGDGMEECQEIMDEMDEETREECQEMMDEEMMGDMDNACPMMDNGGTINGMRGMMKGMMDGRMGNMMEGDGSGMGCH